MKKVTFVKAFTVGIDAMTKLTYPEGWSGFVEDDVAEDAAEDGAIAGSEAAEDETLADDEAALAEMTGAAVEGEQEKPVAEDAAPVAPAKPKK